MSQETVTISGERTIEATLDTPETETDAVAVVAPPHPVKRGDRDDPRLKAIRDYLLDHDVAVLRFDYAEWTEGEGEIADTYAALSWAAERYDQVGLTGYSFGATVAALAAADVDEDSAVGQRLVAVSLLAVDVRIGDQDEFDAADALEDIDVPVRVVYASEDDRVRWEPVVERARELNLEENNVDTGHFFVGSLEIAGRKAGEFLVEHAE
ncbi:alpha/beta hydrolase [Halospeciosus flavus]|uniref:Alpha/beta hydrolase n=1 Tax=Halospeciosus flavus TaxID=3032283 RepID=A0ABD5Z9H4_9EURY|nr:alpha/beta hydrolase [Halospeciosus flavus]